MNTHFLFNAGLKVSKIVNQNDEGCLQKSVFHWQCKDLVAAVLCTQQIINFYLLPKQLTFVFAPCFLERIEPFCKPPNTLNTL